MTKRFAFFAFLGIIMLNENVQGQPQEAGQAAVLALAQLKDTIDNGAAASDKKEFEVFGAKVQSDMAIGFGDAVRSKRSNRLRTSELSSPLAQHSSTNKDKRSANFSGLGRQIINSKEMLRTKRGMYEEYNSDDEVDYDYSSSLSSSGSQSDENDRRKRSIAYKRLADIFFN